MRFYDFLADGTIDFNILHLWREAGGAWQQVTRTRLRPLTQAELQEGLSRAGFEQVGTLFQGPFHAKLVKEDGHLLQLSRYIHINPVLAKLVEKPQDWVYSSYQDY